MRITRTTAAVLGIMVATTLAGCGGSAEESPPETGSEASAGGDDASDTPEADQEETEEAPEAVAIERAAFCDDIDAALVEQALGAPSQWLEERAPGETYEIFGQKEKSDTFYCRWQTNKEAEDYAAGDATFAVQIHGKPATPALVESQIGDRADNLEASGKEMGCAEADAEFGEPTWSQVCAFEGDRYNDPNTSALAVGAFGDSLVTCYVQRNGPGGAAPMDAVLDEVCGQLPAALRSS